MQCCREGSRLWGGPQSEVERGIFLSLVIFNRKVLAGVILKK